MDNQDFIQTVKELHGIDVSDRDLRAVQIELFEKTQHRRLALSLAATEIDADFGKALFIVGGALLGGFLLPGLGLAAGFTQGALLGAAVGYRLAGAFEGGGANTAPNITGKPVYGFSEGGELVLLNEQIPIVYTNSTTNSFTYDDFDTGGGIWLEAKTIYTRIAPTLDSQLLTKLCVLSSGQLKTVSQPELLVDNQQRSNFGASDIVTAVSSGAYNQAALGGITDYCQAVAQNTNAFLGLGASIKAQAVTFAAAVNITSQALVNATYSAGTFTKSGGTANTWDGGGRSQNITLTTGYGDVIEISAKAGELSKQKAFGISTSNTTANLADMNVAVVFRADNKIEIFVGNVSQYVSSGSYTTSQIYRLRLYTGYPTNFLQVVQDTTELWRGSTAISGTVFGDYSLYSTASSMTGCQFRAIDLSSLAGATTDFLPGLGKRFRVSTDRVDAFKTNVYYSNTTSPDARIVATDATSGWIEFDTELWVTESAAQTPLTNKGIKGDSLIYPRYQVVANTTKTVQALELVLYANLDARDSSGNLLQFGVAFELFLDDGTGYQSLGKLMLTAKSATAFYRSIKISNIPRKRYRVKIRPLAPVEVVANTISLGNSGNITVVSTGANFGSGAVAITYDQGKTYTIAEVQTNIDPRSGGKVQTSADAGAPAKLTHINEIVLPANAPTYPGHTVGYQQLLASDRIQSAPQILWRVTEGRLCFNYLAAGTITSVGDSAVADITAQFALWGVQIGDRVRLLGSGYQRVITSMPYPTTLICDTYTVTATANAAQGTLTVAGGFTAVAVVGMPITGNGIPSNSYIESIGGGIATIGDGWGRLRYLSYSTGDSLILNAPSLSTVGEEYVVYRLASSNYLPDILVDRLVNPIDGLGAIVNQNRFIDYESIVKSRRFCVDNNLFYDGIISGTSLESWLTEAASSSLLYPTKINGRYGLIPEQGETIKGIFNASNCFSYEEPYTDWTSQTVNTLLVKFSDSKGRERQVTTQTIVAAGGYEQVISKTVTLRGVINPAQALKVGRTALKSLRVQNRVCKFSTDISNLTFKQGDIIRTQHAIVEYDQDQSGIILEVSTPVLIGYQTSPTTANIIKTLAIGALTLITLDAAHGLATGDSVTIVGHSSAALNGTWLATAYDETRLTVAIPYSAGSGGTVARYRQVYQQDIVLSEDIAAVSGILLSIGRVGGTCDIDVVTDRLSANNVRVYGLETPVIVGSLFIAGVGSQVSREWRVSSISPNLMENKVEVTAVVWDRNILNSIGVT